MKSIDSIVEPLPIHIADARVEVLDEIANHLDLSWTEDKEERRQGIVVSKFLRKCADQIFKLSRVNKIDINVNPCCKEFKKALENRGFSVPIMEAEDKNYIAAHLKPLKYCPWCGKKLNK